MDERSGNETNKKNTIWTGLSAEILSWRLDRMQSSLSHGSFFFSLSIFIEAGKNSDTNISNGKCIANDSKYFTFGWQRKLEIIEAAKD